ncbi:MAG: hypothetical protein RPS47_18770 [Colwellia sp.]|jgi:hypothetical protein
MSVIDLLPAIIGSGVIAAFVTALFSKMVLDKKIRIENITNDRKEWREKIRNLTIEVVKAYQEKDKNEMQRLKAEFAIRLNPDDSDDQYILCSLNSIYRVVWNEYSLERFCKGIACLLKHDWDRSKKESTIKASPQTLAMATLAAGLIFLMAQCLIDFFQLPQAVFIGFVLLLIFLFPALFDCCIARPFSDSKFVAYWTHSVVRIKPYGNKEADHIRHVKYLFCSVLICILMLFALVGSLCCYG